MRIDRPEVNVIGQGSTTTTSTAAVSDRAGCGRTAPTSLPELRLTAVQAFVVLAEELHYGRAAARLFLTPSGLSRQINAVEKAVRARLLRRTSRSVALTPHGHALLPHAQAVVQAAEQALLALALPVPAQS